MIISTLYFLPLFHVVPLDQARQRAEGKAIDPAAFVDHFWTERLIPAATQAVDAAELVTAIGQDRKSARRPHGRSVGVGNALSSEINLRIEQQVLPALRKQARVGATVRFVGCAEIVDEDTDLDPLRIVPFLVETP